MLCASSLQAVQLEALKGKMNKEELEKFHAEICAQFGFLSVCAKIKNEFDSILPQLTQISSGKVCAKIGICKRKKSTVSVVRKATLPVATDLESNGKNFCLACKAMIPVIRALAWGAPFVCGLLSGPAAPICFAIPWATIQRVLKYVQRGCALVNCCQRVGLC